jgi:hypothetical protein
MKRIDCIKQAIKADEQLVKAIDKVRFYDVDMFISDADEYINAIRHKGMICIIHSVSASGMTRNISFHSVSKYQSDYHFRQYYALFLSLGYTLSSKSRNSFKIYGCGMDMIFDTNYSIIRNLHALGFISDSDCNVLCQMTPITF